MKISFIGAGNMTQAFLTGLKGSFFEHEIWVSNRSPEKLMMLDVLNITKTLDNRQAVRDCDILVLAVKPQHMFDLLLEIASDIKTDTIVISLAAGVSLRQLEGWLMPEVKLIRFMPNTAIAIGIGSIAICSNQNIDHPQLCLIKDLFNACGTLLDIDEQQFDLFIAASSSGIAYIYQIMTSYIQVLSALGFNEEQAKSLIIDSFHAASTMAKSDSDLTHLMNCVASKGGITLEGLDVLKSSNLSDILMEMCQKTIQRSKVLSSELQK